MLATAAIKVLLLFPIASMNALEMDLYIPGNVK